MKTPTARHNAGVHLYEWPDELIQVRIDRIREHSDAVTGEITISTLAPGLGPLLHQARLNLTSTSSRNTVAKRLTEEWAEVSWLHCLEYACVLTLQAYREGEPAVLADQEPAPPELSGYRLFPFLREGVATMVYGPKGSGKSLFATYIAILVTAGLADQDMSPRQGAVLYLDYEANKSEFDERLFPIKLGLGIETSIPLYYRRCHRALASEIEDIQRMVMEQETKLVIIDSVGMASGGEIESAPIIALFEAVRSLGITELYIDHVAKAEPGTKNRTPIGTVYKQNEMRSLFEVVSHQENDEEAPIHLGLFNRQSNRGRIKPWGFRIEFAPEVISITREDLRGVPELAKGLPLKERIYTTLLRMGPMELANLAESLEADKGSVRNALNRAKGQLFIQLGNGKWGNIYNETA